MTRQTDSTPQDQCAKKGGEMRTSVLNVITATKSFPGMGRPALDGLSMSASSGCVTAIVGPNGAGKTTLLCVISGLLALDRGSVRISAETGVGTSALLLDSSRGLYPRQTALQNLRYFASIGRPSGRLVPNEECEFWLNAVNLADKRSMPVQALSKGMIQRLNIAIALASRSRLLLLDEPTTGLDIVESTRFVELVRSLTQEHQLITILTSHQPHTILSLGDEVYLISQGRIAKRLEREQLRVLDHEDFVHEYTAAIAATAE